MAKDTSKSDPQTPPAREQTGEGGSGGGKPPSAEEARIQAQRENTLAEKSAELARKLSDAQARAAALEGELEKAQAAHKASEAKAAELERQLARATNAVKNSVAPLFDLPPDAGQLTECVTIVDAKRNRVQAKVGDVILVDAGDVQVEALQKQLGLAARVYAVGAKQAEELAKLGMLAQRR